eukprot:109904_1
MTTPEGNDNFHGKQEDLVGLFENEIAREYVGYIVEEKKKLQNEHNELQQQHLKLQQSYQSMEEHTQNIQKEMEAKDKLVKLLENEVTTLHANKEAQEETINTLNANILDYKHQNKMMQLHNIDQRTIANETDDVVQSVSASTYTNDHDVEMKRLKRELHDYETQQKSFKALIAMHQNELKNLRKHNDEMDTIYLHTKQLNEQQQIEIDTKNEFMARLKDQNEKLQSSNGELLRINNELSDHQHKNKQHQNDHMEIYTNTHEEEQEHKAHNLEMILPFVRHDEYKLNEDLHLKKEHQSSGRIRRSSMDKPRCSHCPSDAEKEFFFMLVWTIKLELSTDDAHMVSDIGAQSLWIKAHGQGVPMHQFYAFIKEELVQNAMKDKGTKKEIRHHWNSKDSIIHNQKKEKRVINAKTKTKTRKRKRVLLPVISISDQQILVEEEEEEHPRRNSQTLKELIVESYQQLQQHHV